MDWMSLEEKIVRRRTRGDEYIMVMGTMQMERAVAWVCSVGAAAEVPCGLLMWYGSYRALCVRRSTTKYPRMPVQWRADSACGGHCGPVAATAA